MNALPALLADASLREAEVAVMAGLDPKERRPWFTRLSRMVDRLFGKPGVTSDGRMESHATIKARAERERRERQRAG